jgi:hypothetical protein
LDRAELDLLIDRRLGTAFPRDRRQALWTVQREVRRWWPYLILSHLISKLTRHQAVVRRGPPGFMRRLYAKVLDEEDLDRFLGDRMPPNI